MSSCSSVDNSCRMLYLVNGDRIIGQNLPKINNILIIQYSNDLTKLVDCVTVIFDFDN